MNYRSDIDGLRSIAVMLVIINHAGFSFLPGGFIGVDVFFVLSGFLITTIIAEKVRSESFNFQWFFVRRIKRLLPASFAVLFATGIAFSFIMLPDDLTRFYKSIIWVCLYMGNIFFWREHGGYFGGDAAEAPLLHTWSLAVEEQYYLIWPAMLILSFRFLGPKRSAYFFVACFVLLTLMSEWATKVTISAAYYLLPARFFELMAGSLLALFWHRLPSLPSLFQNILSIIGGLLILFSAVLLSEHHSFPGYNAMYPVVGTVLLIWTRNGWLNQTLSLNPFVFTGKISYSMYLWHWPIFTYFRYSAIELTLPIQISCILLTYILSILSWKYIEQPFRTSAETRFKPITLKYFVIPSILLSAISFVGISNQGFPHRFSAEELQMEAALTSYANESRALCHAPLRSSERPPNINCIEGEPSNADIFLFGDSHANHFVPFLHVLTRDANLSMQDYTLDQCAPFLDLEWGRSAYKARKCKERNDQAWHHINEKKFKYVVLSASWPGLTTRKIHIDGRRITDKSKIEMLIKEKLDNTINQILALGSIPVIIEDTPDLGGKSPKCPLKREVFNNELDCQIIRPENRFFSELASDLQKKYQKLRIIKPRSLICEDSNCQMSKRGIPLYRDDDHLNEEGAKLLGSTYLNSIGNPFLN